MKKWLCLLSAMVFSAASVQAAEILQVESLTKFSTAEYPAEVQLRALNDINLSTDIQIKEGYTVTGNTVSKNPDNLYIMAFFRRTHFVQYHRISLISGCFENSN